MNYASIASLGLSGAVWSATTLLTACSGVSVGEPVDTGPAAAAAGGTAKNGGGAVSGASGAGSSSAGSPGDDCRSEVPSAAVLASTPRADQNVELLALKLSGQVVADQSIYDRLVRDIGAIRAEEPSISGISYFAADDGKSMLLEVDAATLGQIRDGSYSAWDCLNAAYGLTSTMPVSGGQSSYVQVVLKGNYRLDQVEKQYAKLDGVLAASAAFGGGDGPTICVTREQDTWHYVFDDASGDCPAGCTTHVYKHFSTDGAGTVTSLGEPAADDIRKYASDDACR